jgi:hypothetical protein
LGEIQRHLQWRRGFRSGNSYIVLQLPKQLVKIEIGVLGWQSLVREPRRRVSISTQSRKKRGKWKSQINLVLGSQQVR